MHLPMIQKHHLRVMLSRVDNIGDVVLTLPLIIWLKRRHPGVYVMFLARDYVRAVVTSSLADEFVSWDVLEALSTPDAVTYMRALRADVFIHVFPKRKIASLVAKANIPWRIGTNRRWFHYLYCNRLVSLGRKHSSLHESQLNLSLLTDLGFAGDCTLQQLQSLLYLEPQPCVLPEDIEFTLSTHQRHVIIHPLSNGHGREWPLEHYIALIQSLQNEPVCIWITGLAKEKEQLFPLLNQCPSVRDVCGRLNLEQIMILIQRVDVLLASGTGPLHVAAAIGIGTLGLFPPAQRINPQRWAPLGRRASYLFVSETSCQKKCRHPNGDDRTCACMVALSVEEVRSTLLDMLKTK